MTTRKTEFLFCLFFFCKRPRPGDPPRIERDDFPAPPYPYTDPERRRRWSETSRRISVSENSDVDGRKHQHQTEYDENDCTPDDPKVKVCHYFVFSFLVLS